MKKRMLAAAMAAVMAVSLAGCSGGDKTTETPAGNAGTEAGKENSGSEIERKEYTLVYAAELAHINYLKSSLSTCTRFTENYIDGLVGFDKYGVVKPALAPAGRFPMTVSPTPSI